MSVQWENGWLSVTLACKSEGYKKPGVEYQHNMIASEALVSGIVNSARQSTRAEA
jgi:hypothetical protein